jgi:bacillithiol system protein YtxJ
MSIHWIQLESPEQLQQIRTESASQIVLIYKHSTRCSISSTVLNRMERSPAIFGDLKLYFLDLLHNREVSNLVEDVFSVRHESPQLLAIKGGEVVFHLSHFEIDPGVIRRHLPKN